MADTDSLDAHGYFERRRDQIGTHSDVCWQHHPDCAYWLGRSFAESQLAEARESAERLRKWLSQCGAESNGMLAELRALRSQLAPVRINDDEMEDLDGL